jgi:DNA ligase-1
MLAERKTPPLEILKYPLYASFKIDGIRGAPENGIMLSRSCKPIPSAYVQENFSWLSGFDGELVCGPPNDEGTYARSHSACMTHGCRTPVDYYVFDYRAFPNTPFQDRLLSLKMIRKEGPKLPNVHVLEQKLIWTPEELAEYEGEALDQGYEGLIVRSPTAPYKYGRSTLREGGMIKIKRTLDSEAVVVGWEELYRNTNEAKVNEVGRTARSTHQANMVPADTLGALIGWDPAHDWQFRCGVFRGVSKDTLKNWWEYRTDLKNRIFKYEYLPKVKDLPRHPRFVGWRSPLDMSPT